MRYVNKCIGFIYLSFGLLLILAVTSVSIGTATASTLDPALVAGWPKVVTGINTYYQYLAPTVADLGGDGNKELILGLQNGTLYAFKKDGTNYPGFPFIARTGDHFIRQVNAADLNNDGKKEIIATAVTYGGSRIYIVKSDGTAYSGWTQPLLSNDPFNDDTTPTVADLNGDGRKEIVAVEVQKSSTSTNVRLDAFNLDGTQLAGFPKSYTLPGWGSSQLPVANYGMLSIADVNGDGKPEIAWGFSNRLYLFDNAGNILSGWPFIAPAGVNGPMVFESAAASGDVYGNGKLGLFSVASVHGCPASSCGIQLYGWNINGSVLSGWPRDSLSSGIYFTNMNPYSRLNTPALADVNHDGKDEVIVGLSNLTVFDSAGKKITNLSNKTSTYMFTPQPALSDVNGDGNLEFAGGVFGTLNIYNINGSIYWQRSLPNAYIITSPVIADLDNNGKMDVAVMNRPNVDDGTGIVNLTIYLFEIPTSNPAKYEWPMFSNDLQRTGRLNLSASISPPTADTTPPITSITSPASGSTVSGTITVQASASDNVGVTKVEMYRNGVLVGTDTASPYTFTWNTSQSANGLYSLQSKAYDAVNNVGASSLVSVTVNNTKITPPTVSISSPSNGAILNTATVAVSGTAADAGSPGIQNVQVSVDSGPYTSATGTTSWSFSTSSLLSGSHTITAKATDYAGNTATTSITITVDTTSPTVSITSPSGSINRKSTVTIVVSASDLDNGGVTLVQFYVNGALQCSDTGYSGTSYTCNWNVLAKPGAIYSLQAKAYDTAGNVGYATDTVTSK